MRVHSKPRSQSDQLGGPVTRRAMGWTLFVLAGIYCMGIAMLGRLAFAYGYPSGAYSTIPFIRYLLPLLILPLFLVTLAHRRWATIPLWVLCLLMYTFPFLITDANLRKELGYFTQPLGREIKTAA